MEEKRIPLKEKTFQILLEAELLISNLNSQLNQAVRRQNELLTTIKEHNDCEYYTAKSVDSNSKELILIKQS